MKRIFSMVSLFVFLTLVGCGGLAVGTYGKQEQVRTSFSLQNGRNEFSYSERTNPYKKSEIIEAWGEPDDFGNEDNCEVLIYNDGTSWSGAGGFVGIVPVPLAVPTGKYKNRFYLVENLSVGLIQEYGEVDRAVGYMCGSNECSGLGDEKVNEPEVSSEEAIQEWCSASL